ncbi:hypothetical protein RRG08_013857 [Elysia crispata]|uniref:Uncharacterized protein n=1 Tax=Elysia crispata TaxID=231223 RepID=A0AAE1D0N3_9GAST|nr:hypothetical protein RRG08_013857 [Elysia crispata]
MVGKIRAVWDYYQNRGDLELDLAVPRPSWLFSSLKWRRFGWMGEKGELGRVVGSTHALSNLSSQMIDDINHAADNITNPLKRLPVL